jgi:hypothetical protein
MVFPPNYSCVNSQAPRSNDNRNEVRVMDLRFKVSCENYGGPRKKTASLGVEGRTIVVAGAEAAGVTLLTRYWRKVVERNKGGYITVMP